MENEACQLIAISRLRLYAPETSETALLELLALFRMASSLCGSRSDLWTGASKREGPGNYDRPAAYTIEQANRSTTESVLAKLVDLPCE
jgi:hypothetical protein